jgi:hypothetical protein
MAVLRRASGLVLFGLAVGLLGADENPATSATGSTDDAITAARRDFDVIKGARAPAEQQRLDLPGLSQPTLHLSGDEMSAFRESQAAQRKKEQAAKPAKSANWLVDAMMENKPAESGSSKSARLPGTGPNAEIKLATDLPEAADTGKKAGVMEARRGAALDNPLTTYMAAWMTPKDFDLLKVKTAESNFNAGPDQALARPADAVALDGLMRGDSSVNLGRNSAPVIEPRVNPYLADLAPGPADAGFGLTAPGGGNFAPPTTAPLVPKNDLAPVKTEVPPGDLLKKPGDAKYFPQLKRF